MTRDPTTIAIAAALAGLGVLWVCAALVDWCRL